MINNYCLLCPTQVDRRWHVWLMRQVVDPVAETNAGTDDGRWSRWEGEPNQSCFKVSAKENFQFELKVEDGFCKLSRHKGLLQSTQNFLSEPTQYE